MDKLQLAIDALQFYAHGNHKYSHPENAVSDYHWDNGERAREALATIQDLNTPHLNGKSNCPGLQQAQKTNSADAALTIQPDDTGGMAAGETGQAVRGTAAPAVSQTSKDIHDDVELAASLLAQEGYVHAAMRLKAAWKSPAVASKPLFVGPCSCSGVPHWHPNPGVTQADVDACVIPKVD